MQIFFTAFVLCIFIKLKTEGQTIYRKPHAKLQNLPWVSLIGLWTSWLSRLGLIYIWKIVLVIPEGFLAFALRAVYYCLQVFMIYFSCRWKSLFLWFTCLWHIAAQGSNRGEGVVKIKFAVVLHDKQLSMCLQSKDQLYNTCLCR